MGVGRMFPHQAARQTRLGLGDEKDEDGVGYDPPHGGGALHVKSQHHVRVHVQLLAHLLLGDALVLPVHHGVFDQLPLVDHLLKTRVYPSTARFLTEGYTVNQEFVFAAQAVMER